MRYIGIDFGTEQVGIAISDEGGSFAFPRENVEPRKALERLAALAKEERVSAFVMGDTRAMNGVANPVSAQADAFATKLAEATGLPIHKIGEAWSTVEAARFAPPGKKHDDSAAAAIILQRFLDKPRAE